MTYGKHEPFERAARRFRVMWWIVVAGIIAVALVQGAAVVYAFKHPEVIGSWIGRLWDGVQGKAP